MPLFIMTSVTYIVETTPHGYPCVQVAEDLSKGSEMEKRICRLLKIAVDAAGEQIALHLQDGIIIEKEGIARKAREAMKEHLKELE